MDKSPAAKKALYASLVKAATQYGEFKIDAEIGRGGFGVIHRAISTGGRTYVMKEIPKEKKADLLDELFAHTFAMKHTDRVAKIFAVFERDQSIFTLMQYIDGPTLSELIGSAKPISHAMVQKIFRQIVDIGSLLHRYGLLHGDLSTSNIMLDAPYVFKNEHLPNIYVIDFGLAIWIPDGFGIRNCLSGTYCYMAPEVLARGGIRSKPSDVFSVAIIAMKLVFRQSPFQRCGAEMDDILSEKFGPYRIEIWRYLCETAQESYEAWNSMLPPQMRSILLQMTSFDPMGRPEFDDIKVSPYYKMNFEYPRIGLLPPKPTSAPSIGDSWVRLDDPEYGLIPIRDIQEFDAATIDAIKAKIERKFGAVAAAAAAPNNLTYRKDNDAKLLANNNYPDAKLVENGNVAVEPAAYLPKDNQGKGEVQKRTGGCVLGRVAKVEDRGYCMGCQSKLEAAGGEGPNHALPWRDIPRTNQGCVPHKLLLCGPCFEEHAAGNLTEESIAAAKLYHCSIKEEKKTQNKLNRNKKK